MTTINLKDFYAWYTHDEYIEVSDEVAAELRADKLYELAHQRRITRNKAQYSLDCDDGIEYSACLHIHYNCIGAFDVTDRRKIPEADIIMETRKGVALSYAPEQVAV